MSSPFMGEIRVFAGSFAPQNWALCDGQQTPIAQNEALFSLVGTTYGGDGVNTFALPDARGRVPIGIAQGPGLTARQLGQRIGTETVTLVPANIPTHTHAAVVSDAAADQAEPGGNFIGRSRHYLPSTTQATNTGALNYLAVTNVGGSQPHENMMPFLCLNFILCLQGIYPSRN